jgi:hypothetical protein
MKAFLVSLSLCLALLVGTALWLSYGDCTSLPKRLYHKIFLGEKDFIDKAVRFKARGSGTLLLPNGRLAGFTTVRASDCVMVTSEADDEGSPLQADQEMERRIREATCVIERAPVIYGNGEGRGERVVLLTQEELKVSIISSRQGDRKLYVIHSESLAHALAYEKLIQSGYRLDPHGYVIGAGQ